jgi:hypothetical protein
LLLTTKSEDSPQATTVTSALRELDPSPLGYWHSRYSSIFVHLTHLTYFFSNSSRIRALLKSLGDTTAAATSRIYKCDCNHDAHRTPSTILLGHSLESDLRALQLSHPQCIDDLPSPTRATSKAGPSGLRASGSVAPSRIVGLADTILKRMRRPVWIYVKQRVRTES